MPIVEIADQTKSEIVSIGTAEKVGLLVHGNIDIDDRLAQLRTQNIQGACIAYVMPEVARRKRRCYALAMGLSSRHKCPCAVFTDENKARALLSSQLNPASVQ
ncbi:MAG: hypothetical protein KC496_01790 [Anaerolineae bacterium]|nr:hypothetical protein [Anaerolineae bacterium]